MNNKLIMLIDGSSLLHRAFYALPLLTTKKGLYTNGVYGFLTMFYRIENEYKPDFICVAFDKKGPTFRKKVYADYKGTRQSTPSELAQQFPIIKEILNDMDIKTLEMDEYEADDIVGTLAKKAEEMGMDAILVTGDKDYFQLATDKNRVFLTRKGISEMDIFDREKINIEYGIQPYQFIDLKGLMGDKSDNIPGVPGIGEKTGLKLIKEYENLDNIYENIENISGKKLKENLVENKSQAYMSRELGKIITNIPLDYRLEDFKVNEPNYENLKKIYKELEFKSLLAKLPDSLIVEDTETIDYKYELFNGNYKQLTKKINDEKKFAFKFVVSSNNYIEDKIIGLAVKTQNTETVYLDFTNGHKDFIENFRDIFENENIKKIGYGIKLDIVQLFRLGLSISNYTFDGLIAQYVLDPSQSDYSIKNLCEEYLNTSPMSEEELLGKGKAAKSFSTVEKGKLMVYLSSLMENTFLLEKIMLERIEEQGMIELYNSIELPIIEVLASMEYCGVKVNKEELDKLGKEYDEEINDLISNIYELAEQEFNINSPKQIGDILFEKLQLPVIKKTKTGYSTDAEVLEALSDKHPIIDKILRYRQIVKLKSTYIDGLRNLINVKTKRIHSSFNQTIASTGRISSTEPNLQNIPVRTEDGRKIRKAFITESDDYTLIDADYSQIELRVLAHISEDPKMISAFKEGVDIHTKTASEVFHVPLNEVTSQLRYRAKAVNFGIIYGISDYGLSKDLDISRKDAKEYIENYFKNYIHVRKYMDSIIEEGRKNGYVETILKRRRYIPELNAKNFNVRSFGERVALNTPIQGSAADIIKIAMVRVYNALKENKLISRLILTVHDELIIEAYKEEVDRVEKMMKDIMEGTVELRVPLIVDIKRGGSWYETK